MAVKYDKHSQKYRESLFKTRPFYRRKFYLNQEINSFFKHYLRSLYGKKILFKGKVPNNVGSENYHVSIDGVQKDVSLSSDEPMKFTSSDAEITIDRKTHVSNSNLKRNTLMKNPGKI